VSNSLYALKKSPHGPFLKQQFFPSHEFKVISVLFLYQDEKNLQAQSLHCDGLFQLSLISAEVGWGNLSTTKAEM